MQDTRYTKHGSALILVVFSIVILSTLGVGLLAVSYGVRHRAIMVKNETSAMLAAEAGYEKAIFWMSQQRDMLSAIQKDVPGISDSISFSDGNCDYEIKLRTFVGSRPIYQVISNGRSGRFNRAVDVLVFQAVSGWDMGMCRVPSSPTKTISVYYADGEIIDMPLHINNLNDSPDRRDINITGNPNFLRSVAMSESRHTSGDSDKYTDVMGLFDNGIYFDQPESRVTDEATIQSKVDRFKNSTKSKYSFQPVNKTPAGSVTRPNAAVQLEFFVNNEGIGKVSITNNCTVRGFQQDTYRKTYDLKIEPGSDGKEYETYDIYGYHLKPTSELSITKSIANTYVTQTIGNVESEPGGQIFVDGNVVIGSSRTRHNGNQLVKGRITVVATGNIWIADSISVDGAHDADGKPSEDNPNILGLVAQGVVKVVDPGMSDYSYVDDSPDVPSNFVYRPIGQYDSGQSKNSYKRHLPDPMVVESAITVGGGGWGAENVMRRYRWKYYGGRKEEAGKQDKLLVRGTITEAVRGVVGLIGADGYLKYYYLDERLLEGILPGDMWLRGKYIPAPAGWHDYRAASE